MNDLPDHCIFLLLVRRIFINEIMTREKNVVRWRVVWVCTQAVTCLSCAAWNVLCVSCALIPDQRRRKLESLKVEEDLTSATQKLTDQIIQLNEQRFQLAMKIKVMLHFLANLFFSCHEQAWNLYIHSYSFVTSVIMFSKFDASLHLSPFLNDFWFFSLRVCLLKLFL